MVGLEQVHVGNVHLQILYGALGGQCLMGFHMVIVGHKYADMTRKPSLTPSWSIAERPSDQEAPQWSQEVQVIFGIFPK